jgi:hypothetical protein
VFLTSDFDFEFLEMLMEVTLGDEWRAFFATIVTEKRGELFWKTKGKISDKMTGGSSTNLNS